MSNEKTTKAYKVDPEIRTKVETLFADSGLSTEGEFLAHLASLFEMQQMKEGSAAGYAKQINELEIHARRTVELFLSMIQTEAAEKADLSDVHAEQLSEQRNAYLDAQEQIQTLLRDSDQAWSEVKELKEDVAESMKLVQQLQKTNERSEELIGEYRQRIDDMSKIVTDQREATAEAADLRKKVDALSQVVYERDREIAQMRDALEASQKRSADDIRQLSEQHAAELQRATERAEIAQEKAVLAARRDAEATREALLREGREANDANLKEIRLLYAEVDKLRQQLAAPRVTVKQSKKEGESK